MAPPLEPIRFSLESTVFRFSGFFYQCYLIPLSLALIILALGGKKKTSPLRIAAFTASIDLLATGIYFLLASVIPDFKALGFVSQIVLLALILAYAVFFSPMDPHVRIVVAAAVIADINWVQSISTQVLMPNLALGLSNALQLTLLIGALAVVVIFRPSRSSRIPAAYWLSMLIIAAISTICLYSIRVIGSRDPYSSGSSTALSITLLAFFVVNQLIYYLYHVLVRAHRAAMEMETMQAKLEQDLEFYKRSDTLIREYRSLRHELKNHFSVMETLLRERHYDQLQQYFEDYTGSIAPSLEEFRCANPLVSSILSHQMNTARAAGVRLDVIAAVPETMGIADNDLCSLLSNMLDNSVEGCLRAGQSEVKASLHTDKNCLFITVTNPATEDVLSANPNLFSTKNNPTAHGFGIPIIRRIAEKYDGIVTFHAEDGWFTADAMLYLEEV